MMACSNQEQMLTEEYQKKRYGLITLDIGDLALRCSVSFLVVLSPLNQKINTFYSLSKNGVFCD